MKYIQMYELGGYMLLPHWINGQYFLNDLSPPKRQKDKQTLHETIIKQ